MMLDILLLLDVLLMVLVFKLEKILLDLTDQPAAPGWEGTIVEADRTGLLACNPKFRKNKSKRGYYSSFAIQLRWVFTCVTNGTSPNKWLKLKNMYAY